MRIRGVTFVLLVTNVTSTLEYVDGFVKRTKKYSTIHAVPVLEAQCVILIPMSNSRCAHVKCPAGYLCDNNSGNCKKFRIPRSSYYEFLRRNRLRSIGNSDRCQYMLCPEGMQCDSNSGSNIYIIPFRPLSSPKAISDICRAVICPQGLQCDSNTGICRKFRQILDDASTSNLCDGVICPEGMQCDSNAGICRQFRSLSDNPVALHPCNALACPQEKRCNLNSGL
ncbi:hypothetical protein DICVIV_08440 [Dictyocaulus viviparus]|uniref:EB module n=1 Tax=Dictyocaulus viviparus TaxID=29172 RepID=A0A0D8XLK7_DICVI|nr:hypothetical protein DICVIV_08440 [Dictyocaulus viviparus]